MAAPASAAAEFVAQCAALQRGSDTANKWLVDFRAQPQALEVAKQVVQSCADMVAQFHATQVISDVVVRRWDALPPAERQGVRNYILGLVFERWAHLHASVRNKLLQTVAVFWKRGWLEESAQAKVAFLTQVQSLLRSSGGGSATQLMGMHLIVELLGQFSEGKSHSIAMPLEFHRACRQAFQRDGQHRMLWSLAHQVVVAEAKALVGKGDATSRAAAAARGDSRELIAADHAELLSMALTVMNDCLEWQCEKQRGDKNDKCPIVTLGAEWRALVIEKDAATGATLADILFTLYGAVRFLVHTSLPHKTREAILQLCCVSGPVFADHAVECAMFQRLLNGVLGMALQPISSALSGVSIVTLATSAGTLAEEMGSEILAAGQAIYRLIENYKPRVVCALPGGATKTAIQQISKVTNKLLEDAASSAAMRVQASQRAFGTESHAVGDLLEQRGAWMLEAFDYVLEGWVSLLTAPEVMGAPDSNPTVALLKQCCGGLFSTLVNRRLEIASAVIAAGIDDDDPYEDTSKLQEHLEYAAVIARADPKTSLHTLTTLVRQQTLQVKQASAAAATPTAGFETAVGCLNEKLFWLAWIAGHVLADESEGETALVPPELNKLSAAAGASAAHASRKHKFQTSPETLAADPVVALISAMFDLVSVESTLLQANPGSPYLSPLLMTKLLWFMDRWARSYLMPNLREYFEVALSPNLTRCYATTKGSAGGVGTPTTPTGGAGAAGAGAASPHGAAPSGRFASADGIAEFIGQTSVLALALWPSEPECAGHALDCLQHLVANRSIASMLLVSSTWQALVRAEAAVVNGDSAQSAPAVAAAMGPLAGLLQLTADDQRRLVALMVGATKGARLGDDDSITFMSGGDAGAMAHMKATSTQRMQAYFTSVARPVLTKLQAMLAQPCFATVPYPVAAQTPAVTSEVIRIMGLCQGAVCPAFVVEATWLLPVALPMLEKCSQLITGYGIGHLVTRAALEFARAFVDAQLPVLKPAPSQQVYQAVAKILAAYDGLSDSRAAGRAGPLAAAARDERRDDIIALLQLVSCLVTKDGLDWGDGSTGEVGAGAGAGAGATAAASGVHVIDVALFGLRVVVGLVKPGMLGFPALARLYIRVIGELFDQYPERIAPLDAGLVSKLLQVVTDGIQRPNAVNQRVSLEAMYSLARHHASALQAARGVRSPTVGLCAHIARDPELLVRFIQHTLTLLLSTSCPDSLIDPASNLLLALVLSEQQAFIALAQRFVSQQPSAELQARLRDAFGKLTTANGIQMGGRPFLRPNRARFQANVRDFVRAVRAFVVIK